MSATLVFSLALVATAFFAEVYPSRIETKRSTNPKSLGPPKANGCRKSMSWSPSQRETSTFDFDQISENFTLYNNIYGASLVTRRSFQSTKCESYQNGVLSWRTSYEFDPTSQATKNSVKSYSNAAWRGKPRKISQVTRLDTEWNWEITGGSADLTCDVAYDFFTSSDADCPGQAAGCVTHEIMVWLASVGGASPAGTRAAGRTIKLGRYQFDVWEGSVGVQVFSLVPSPPGTTYKSFKADLLPALKNLESLGLGGDEYIISIGAGPEPFKGRATLETRQYTLQID